MRRLFVPLVLVLFVAVLAACVGVQEAGKPRLVLPYEVPLNETALPPMEGCVPMPPPVPEKSFW